ncbi:MAG TPA: hypothetical protein VH328_12780 [Burkholderiaceae bacterium]|nr:hypothetical protein [Burkholderiaceae bacterium]
MLRRLLPSLLVPLVVLLAGCDQLGIESASTVAARQEADGKAVGAACRHAGRAIEDCFALNRRIEKAAIYTGWREMDDYMRENKMDTVAPVIGPGAMKHADTEAAASSDDAASKSAGGDQAAAKADARDDAKAGAKAAGKQDAKAEARSNAKVDPKADRDLKADPDAKSDRGAKADKTAKANGADRDEKVASRAGGESADKATADH